MSATTPPVSTLRPGQAGPRRQRPRVVVVGGGFAGLWAVRELSVADVDVLLVDRNAYNTFQPLLYQVATAGLNPGDVTYALRAFTSRFRNADFLRAEVTNVDPDAQEVVLGDGQREHYDYLVVSVGVGANFFGIPGADRYAQTMYTRTGAIAVRDRIMTAVEDAAQGKPGAPDPTVVVVGGGATGVEMAGALAELRNAAIPVAYRGLDPERVQIVLVEMADALLLPFKPKLQKYALRELRRRGVNVRLRTAVDEVHERAVVVKRPDGEHETIPCASVVWASGVSANSRIGSWELPKGKNGRVETEDDLSVKGFPNIYAVGDVGIDDDDPLPQLAQPAIQGGKHAGVQIRRRLAGAETEPFVYHDKGTMATIGRNDAVVQFPFGLTLRGPLAWLSWLALHIFYLVGYRNRLATLINLSVRYLSWPRSLNIVVGDPTD